MKSIATLIFISVVFTSCHFNHKQVSSTPIQRHLDDFDSLFPLHDLISTKVFSKVDVEATWDSGNVEFPSELSLYLNKSHRIKFRDADSTLKKMIKSFPCQEMMLMGDYSSEFLIASRPSIGKFKSFILCSIYPTSQIPYYPAYYLAISDKNKKLISVLKIHDRVDLNDLEYDTIGGAYKFSESSFSEMTDRKLLTHELKSYVLDNDNNDIAYYDSITVEHIIHDNGRISSRRIDSTRIFNTKVKDRSLHYTKVTNPKYRFSFEIPKYWKVDYDKDYMIGFCTTTTTFLKNIYSDCFGNIRFHVRVYTASLDSVLRSEYYEKSNGGSYILETGFGDIDEEIKGINWNGHYHLNYCRNYCKSSGSHFSGENTNIFFSNGKVTVLIDTESGFSDKELARFKNSFRFY